MVKVAKTPLGFFAFSATGEVVEKMELPERPEEAAKLLAGKAFEEWVEELKSRGYAIDGSIDLSEALELLGISVKEYFEKAREVLIELAKLKIKEAVGRDYLMIQAISALDDLNKTLNILFNRFREWYGLYRPEDAPEELKDLTEVSWEAPGAMGVNLTEEDLKALKGLYKLLKNMLNLRKELEEYIEQEMPKIAPNLAALATPRVAARLLERAGSLKALAFMPGSTIQVLGAEKALFKHLQRGTPPPKHGVLLQHPVIARARKKLRGKLARALAAKLAIAARLDLAGKGLSRELIEEWEKRKEEILKGEEK